MPRPRPLVHPGALAEQIARTTANDGGVFSNVGVTIPDSLSFAAPQQFSIVATGQRSIKSADAPFQLTG